MKNTMFKRALSLVLALVCVIGILPLDAMAAGSLSTAPGSITQKDCDYFYNGSHPVRYKSASDTINAAGLPYVFDEQVDVPGYGTTRALCAYHNGSLGAAANGQKWNFKNEVTDPSLKALLTWVHSCTYGDFTDAGNARGLPTWGPLWSDVWFVVSQAMTWYYEYGLTINCDTDREGFIRQASEEMVAAFKMFHDTWNSTAWITNWDNVDIYTIIDSNDNGVTGNSAYDYISTGVNLVLDHPEYFHKYRLWEYEWDTTQPWKLVGHSSTEMQRLLIAIPDKEPDVRTVKLTVKKLEAGTNKPIPGVTFKIENAYDSTAFSITRQTGADGTITLTADADNLAAGQYKITEVAAPEGYVAQTASQLVTVLPDDTVDSTFTFYNTPGSGEGSIKKVDADNPTVGIPGAVIKLTSVKLDNGGSFTGTYVTGDGGYISKEDLDFSKLPKGSYLAEEITPPEGFILSSDPAKLRQTFVWDGVHDVSLVFENSAKVRVQLKKVDESGSPLPGAVFLVLRDGQIIATETTKADGAITVSNVTEGYYEFVEVSAPAGFDCDRTPVGVHVNAGDLQGEQTITVTKVNHHKRSLTITKRDAETGAAVANTSFHIRGVNVAFEQDVTTGTDGKATLSDMSSGCYEVTETSVPAPYLLDANNRRTVWIDASEGQDVVVDFVNSTRPGLRLMKTDHDTGKPIAGVTFLIEQIGGSYSEQHITDESGLIVLEELAPGAYTVTEVKPALGYVADATPRTVWLEKDRTTTLELTNVRKPDLRILKYDQQSGKPLAGVTFEVWHNSELLGEYTTDKNGEIYLSGLEPGTYLVKEVATDDDHVVNSTPQQIELTADRTETAQLVFFNSKKPGLHLIKVDSVTMQPLPNVRFEIKKVGGSYCQEFTTDANGEIDLSKLGPGAYEIRELEAPDGYLIDDAVRVVQINPDETASFVFANTPKPSLRLIKTSSDGSRLAGVHFRIAKIEDGTHYLDRITDADGEINIVGLEPGVYSVKETATVADHILDTREYHVELIAGQTSSITIENQKRPSLTIRKTDKDTGDSIPGVTFTLRGADGPTITTEPTGPDGTVRIADLLPGVYTVTEQSVPEGYILDSTPQTVTLLPNREATVAFQNYKRPTLKIAKVDINGKPLTGAIFEVKTKAGVKIGDYPVGADGTVTIPNVQLDEGYYIVTEKQAPTGYILDSTPHEVYLRPGKTTELTIENEKKPGLTIYKVDSVVGDGIKGAKFEIFVSKDKDSDGTYRKLSSSYYTDADGLIRLENLDTGWYRIVEVEPPAGYLLKEPSEQTVYMEHDKAVEVTFENVPKSALVIRKIDAATGEPLANAWFRVRYLGGTSGSGGTVIGEYQTSANGNIIVTGLDAGTYICEEISAPHGYVMDTAPQTAYISGKEQDCITLTFTNSKYGALLIKKVDSVTGEPLGGVVFSVTDSGGSAVGGGTFTTDSAGTVLIPEVKPGTTLVVKEIRAKVGYVLDETAQTALIHSGETATLEFRNQPEGSLLIRKVCATNPSVTLQNAEFKVMYSDGALVGDSNGVYRSDENGEVRIDGLTPGKSVVVTETRAPAGFIIDTQSQTVQVKAGKTVSLTFKNQPKGKLVIQKRDSQTNDVLPGAEFRVTTAAGCEVGLDGVIGTSTLTSNGIFTTDSQGEIRISNLVPGAYVLNEIKAPDGYVIDTPSTNVVIGTGGDTQTVVIKDTIKGNLVVEKYDSVTKQPLSGTRFKITTASGELVADNEGLISSNGLYTTDQNGQIILSKLIPGTYIVTEDKAPDNYQKDPTPQTVVVNAGDTQTLKFYNDPLCTLTILKRDAVTRKPLKDAEFTVKDSDGRTIGQYTTGTDGTVTVTGLAPNSTIVVSESRAPSGYILDETPKHIVVRSGVTNSLTFDNEPGTTLIIRKFIEGTENEPLSGVAFKVVDGAGAAIGPDDGVYYTDHAGEIVLEGIEPGTTVKVREIKTVEGYVLDGTPQDIKIVGGQVQTLTFWNKRAGTLVVQKKDSVSGAPISGAQFQLTYANGGYVDNDNGHLSSNGLYTTDANGEIRISGITGTVVAKEVKAAPGYVIDLATQTQTVTVNPLDTQTLVFLNAPLCSLTITKLDSVTGKPVPGTVFAVKDGNGNLLGSYTTGADGTVTVTGLVPGATVVVSETKVPSGYVLDTTPQTIIVKNGTGNSVTTGSGGNGLTFENDPTMTLTIHKYIEGTANEPLAGVAFKIVDGSGAAVGPGNGVFYTDAAGEIRVEGLEPGATITAREIKTVDGFVLDGTPQTVKITAGSKAPELTFWNKRTCSLAILKQSTNKVPLAGAVFLVTDEDGAAIGTNNGRYTTDRNGLITITGLQPGQVLVVTEEKAPDGYVLDMTPKTIKIRQGSANSLIFENAHVGSLVINKRSSADKKTPLEGVTFKITTANGAFLPDENGKISSNGLYYTDENGQIVLNNVVGTLVVTEVASINGYTISSANRSQTVEVRPDDTQTLYFYNDPLCSLTITKLDSVTGKPLSGAVFTVKDGNGNVLGRYTTGKDGTVTVTGLIPGGTVIVTETSAPSGYVIDPTPQTVTVKNGAKNSLTFENDPKTTLVIEKYITGTTTPLKGVAFLVTDSSGAVVGSSNGEFITDENGRVVIEGLEPGVTVTVREIRTLEGYVLDTAPKSIKIKAGETQTLRFYNQKQGTLVIKKLDSVTKKPLAGVEFQLTYTNGGYVDADNGHLSSNGLYTTDKNGEIRISGVTGTIVVKETRTIDGYTIDPDTCTQTVKVNPQDTQTLTFYNAPKQTLTIQKYVDGTTTPIQGVTFLVTDSSGQFVGPNNGEYVTDRNGRIVLTDLVPGTTITARETRTVSGYVLDTTPQSILIKQGAAQTLTFFNKAEGGLELIKVNEADATQRIPGVTFEIRRMDGGLVKAVTTDASGCVRLNLDAGDYYAVETEAAQGFKLDNTPHYFTVKDGETTTLTVKNKPLSGILIHKTDSVTGKGLYGVSFLLYDSNNAPIGQYTSDNSGYVYIENLTAGGRYYLRELENPGYVPDTQLKTVYVKAGETTLIEWQNTPVTGQIQITKTSADYNSINGWPAGTPIPNTEFEIYNYRTGVLVDTIRTDKNGVAVSKPLPLGRYKVVESKAADFYSLDKAPIEVELEHAGQIVKAAMANKSLYTNVSIKKTGYAEVMPGQSIRYTFSEIGNNSTTSLTSFYWRDTLPVNAVRLDKIVTGTYNTAGSYKVVYKTNLSGGKTYTMYDNLSTAKNYVLDASPAALKLASNEYITEFSFVFGVVPAKFRQVEAPQVYCKVVSWVKGGSQFTNTADIGGVYNGQWIQAVTRWTTKVYGKPGTLPKTGY